MKSKVFVAVFFLIMLLNACKHEVEQPGPATNPGSATTGQATTGNNTSQQPCDPALVYFEKDILPILNSNCAYSGCHDPGTATHGIVLNSYANVMRTAGIIANSAHRSKLYEKITERDADDAMPPAPKQRLSQEQISLIGKWINQGAQNLVCDNGGCDTLNVTYSNQVTQVIGSYCKGCHSGTVPSGNILLTDYTQVKTMVQSGRLICAIEHVSGCSPMPKNGNKLDACKIAMIKKWQQSGFAQ